MEVTLSARWDHADLVAAVNILRRAGLPDSLWRYRPYWRPGPGTAPESSLVGFGNPLHLGRGGCQGQAQRQEVMQVVEEIREADQANLECFSAAKNWRCNGCEFKTVCP